MACVVYFRAIVNKRIFFPNFARGRLALPVPGVPVMRIFGSFLVEALAIFRESDGMRKTKVGDDGFRRTKDFDRIYCQCGVRI